jgi:hypothetical protein
MKRREFIVGLCAAAAWPVVARTQQSDRTRRVGVLMAFSENDPEAKAYLSGFTQRISELGWINGRNVRMDVRWAAGSVDQMQTFAKELVDLQPDVILSVSTPVTAAFQRETRTIPIVFAGVADPVGDGFVASLPRPGGNITGFVSRKRQWGVSGWSCSRKSRRASSESQSCSIPTRLPAADHISCRHSRQPPDHSSGVKAELPDIRDGCSVCKPICFRLKRCGELEQIGKGLLLASSIPRFGLRAAWPSSWQPLG